MAVSLLTGRCLPSKMRGRAIGLSPKRYGRPAFTGCAVFLPGYVAMVLGEVGVEVEVPDPFAAKRYCSGKR